MDAFSIVDVIADVGAALRVGPGDFSVTWSGRAGERTSLLADAATVPATLLHGDAKVANFALLPEGPWRRSTGSWCRSDPPRSTISRRNASIDGIAGRKAGCVPPHAAYAAHVSGEATVDSPTPGGAARHFCTDPHGAG